MRLIAVVMGEESSEVRNQEVSKVLDHGFANYSTLNILDTNSKVGNVIVYKSKIDNIDLIPKEDLTILYKKLDNKPEITYELDIKEIEAPIKKGDIVGKIKVYKNGEYLKNINVTVPYDINRINILGQYIKNIKNIFN